MSAQTSRQPHAIAASCVFDGAVAHRNAAVIISGERIVGLAQRAELPADLLVHEMPDGVWLAPGFSYAELRDGGPHPSRGLLTERGLNHVVACVEAMKEVLGDVVGLALDFLLQL